MNISEYGCSHLFLIFTFSLYATLLQNFLFMKKSVNSLGIALNFKWLEIYRNMDYKNVKQVKKIINQNFP